MPRTHHTLESRIAALQAKIEAIKARAERQKAKKNPVLRHIRKALASVDKAASATEDHATRQALAETRSTLAACLALNGAQPAPQRTLTSVAANSRRSSTAVANWSDDLLRYVTANPGKRGEEIAKALGTESSIMRPHMKRLIEAGSVRTEGHRRAMAYWPA
jgi:hypothetical protein